MDIKSFKLHNFRNYDQQQIIFQKGINLLIGPNGQGKTNALEGIYYLLTGKSYRVKQESELIRWGEKNFYLQGSFGVLDRVFQLESYFENGKKVMKINHLAAKRLSDYVGVVNAVFFSPDDLDIVKRSPHERRRFLDLLIAQIKPSYISLLNNYLKIVKQKNNLLKQERNLKLLYSQLSVWNEQLVETGNKLILERWEFTEKLNTYCRPIFHRIFSQEDQIELSYHSLGKKNPEEALVIFPELLEKRMNQEIEKKTVLFGPHRDDVFIELNGKSARVYASQGQQRALVLCLKLGEMEIIFNHKGEYPILLLDDVLSELDEYRREYLLETIGSTDKQTIITMTGADEKIINQHTKVFRIIGGKVKGE